jgi:hypothetical protein
MKPELPDRTLANWFDRLVKNKLTAIAIPVSGIAISCFLLTFAKLFSGVIFYFISGLGLFMLSVSIALFIYASYRQVDLVFKASAPGLKTGGQKSR